MKLPELRIRDLIAPVPIIQGGMGVGISRSGLASAVADCGGIGVISTAVIGMDEPDFRKKQRVANRRSIATEIRKARELTDGIIGMNIMVALTDFGDHVAASIEEGVDVIFIGAGLPLRFSEATPPEMIRETETAFVPIVSSPRAVQLIFNHWAKRFGRIPDGVVVEGPMAGGHLGFRKEQIDDPAFALELLVPPIIEAVKPFEQRYGRSIPVVAAGGVYTGADIEKYLSMGAAGVQLGTRFVATDECDADPAFKEAFIRARKEDLVIIESPVGLPGRAIRNAFLDDVECGMKKPYRCRWRCLKTCPFKDAPYCIADALMNAQRGEMQDGFPFAGANAWRVSRIRPVRELMRELIDEYETAYERRHAASIVG